MSRLDRSDMHAIKDENTELKKHNIELIDFYSKLQLIKLPMKIGTEVTMLECLIDKNIAEKLQALMKQLKERNEEKKEEVKEETKENNEEVEKITIV